MPMLYRAGERISQWLHDIVYSMPSPNHESDSRLAQENRFDKFADYIEEPGEPKALAGGIGPVSFAGSGYGIMLVITAILLNRIHHIVRRPRIPPPPLPHPRNPSLYYRARIQLTRVLTSHDMPKYIRLPGIIALVRAWILFSVVILQVANLWPTEPRSPWLTNTSYGKVFQRFGGWAGDMEMEQACWQVFLSVCGGLVCGGLANGLDRGRRQDVGAGFNLFGYSFLLHLYSSPLTHHRPPPAAHHGRPDIHALFQLWLSLTELTWLQAIELSTSLRRNQIVPTGVCGLLGLGHFVYALSTSPLRVPSFTFLTHLLALFLGIVILLTLVLRAFTFIFTCGYIPSPIFSSLIPHDGVRPSIEDDFGVALLKLGTACMEATQYSGLRNELVGIEERQAPWLQLSADSSEIVKPRSAMGGFSSEITDIKVPSLEDPHTRTAYYAQLTLFWKAFGNALLAVSWAILMSSPVGRKAVQWSRVMWQHRWWYGPRQWTVWRRAAWAEPEQFRRPVISTRETWESIVRAARATHQPLPIDEDTRRLYSMSPDSSPYEDFLRGDVGSDEEDAEMDWEEASDADSTLTVMPDEDEMPEHEPDLYRDLMHAEPTADLQPVLLAHLTSTSTLTRRRYNSLISSSSTSRALTPTRLEEVMQERRAAVAGKKQDEWDEERRKSCIVCMTEQRDTILWPCRCLALCNDCRESLAARLTPAEHMCPCCRRKVEGFSRIWIP